MLFNKWIFNKKIKFTLPSQYFRRHLELAKYMNVYLVMCIILSVYAILKLNLRRLRFNIYNNHLLCSALT